MNLKFISARAREVFFAGVDRQALVPRGADTSENRSNVAPVTAKMSPQEGVVIAARGTSGCVREVGMLVCVC